MRGQQTTVLSAESLCRSFNGEKVLTGVNIKLHKGTSTAIIGPSGTGKSTLLSILGLLLNKTAGRLEIYEKDIDGLGAPALARHRRLDIGYVFQNTQLIGSLRALDNVLITTALLQRADNQCIGARLVDKPKDSAKANSLSDVLRQRAKQLLLSFGLENRSHHFPHQLSIGQKRRVAVARALLLVPPIILADEPTNDLDADSAQLVTESLFAAVAQGQTLVYATHDKSLADRADAIIDLCGKNDLSDAAGILCSKNAAAKSDRGRR
jgi:ABC-type lipoprotein export system ATPase subunit